MNYKHYILYLLYFLCLFPKSSLTAKEEADYIVIGAGTAGATISKLLSDDFNTSVITIHNGKNFTQNPNIKYSRNAPTTILSALIGPPFFQNGFSSPQPSVDGREIFWAMGVPEGGTSSVNAGAWARGTNQVYSQWEPIAGPEWSTTQIQNIYTSLEKYKGLTPDPALRGYHGPINVRQVPIPTSFSLKFSQAVATATGEPIVLDYNDINTPIGVSPQLQYTQKGCNGKFRVSSATAFLNRCVVTPNGKGVGGRKLNIKYKSTALRTLWKDNKAVGVVYSRNGIERKAYAKKGVIVCGGLFSSAFLMHSGVGPKEVLQPLGIDVKFDNPNVGAVLADQTLLLSAFATNPDDTPVRIRKSFGNGLIDHLSFRKLKRILFHLPVIANLHNANDKKQLTNVLLSKDFSFPENSIFAQISWLPTPGGDPTIRTVRISTVNPIPGLAFAIIDLIQPQSRGRITINSANPFDPPVIDPGTFSNPADLELYVQTFQVYIKNINAILHAMDEKYELIFPPPAILDDVDLLTAFIKEVVGSSQCWQSHCRMAPLAQGGVVNSIGQVYGVQNLYVADDSIVPVAMDGTPMASAYLIAANIARLLQQ